MQKIENHVEVMGILKNELSRCFKHGDEKSPLAIGIHESILKHFENDARFDAQTLLRAFSFYCKGTRYLKSIVEGASRIDINGNPVSSVKKSEASYALRILAARKAMKEKKEGRKEKEKEKEKNQESKRQATDANQSLSKIQKKEKGGEVELSLS